MLIAESESLVVRQSGCLFMSVTLLLISSFASSFSASLISLSPCASGCMSGVVRQRSIERLPEDRFEASCAPLHWIRCISYDKLSPVVADTRCAYSHATSLLLLASFFCCCHLLVHGGECVCNHAMKQTVSGVRLGTSCNRSPRFPSPALLIV